MLSLIPEHRMYRDYEGIEDPIFRSRDNGFVRMGLLDFTFVEATGYRNNNDACVHSAHPEPSLIHGKSQDILTAGQETNRDSTQLIPHVKSAFG